MEVGGKDLNYPRRFFPQSYFPTSLFIVHPEILIFSSPLMGEG
jgi:hypothetical protein